MTWYRITNAGESGWMLDPSTSSACSLMRGRYRRVAESGKGFRSNSQAMISVVKLKFVIMERETAD